MVADEKPLQGLSLLVVEDDYLIAIYMVLVLQQLGAGVVGPVASVKAALAEIEDRRDQLSAAILDVNLGNEKVFGVSEALDSRDVPFIFATGYDSQVIPARFRHVPRLEKPIDRDQLATVILEVTPRQN